MTCMPNGFNNNTLWVHVNINCPNNSLAEAVNSCRIQQMMSPTFHSSYPTFVYFHVDL